MDTRPAAIVLAFLALGARASVHGRVPRSAAAVVQSPAAIWDSFGDAVAGAGDVDLDGVPDILVGAPLSDRTRTDNGRVLLFSGATGAVLQEWIGSASHARLGTAVGSLGDVDGDGVPDPFLGAAGSVVVHSGVTQRVLHRFEGCGDPEDFGSPVAALGDVDGDGVNDLGVCETGSWRVLEVRGGRAFVFSGADGSVLHALNSEESVERGGAPPRPGFGRCIAGVGDLDGDGCADFGVGYWPRTFYLPADVGVEVFSGRTGATLLQVPHGGSALTALGDQDGDQVGDFATSLVAASLVVVSGADGIVLHEVSYAGGYMDGEGHSLARVGDLDRDGVEDLFIGRQETCCDYDGDCCVELLYGRRWERERLGARSGTRCAGHPDEWNVVAAVGNIDGDEIPDLAVGYPISGSVRIVSGATHEDLLVLSAFDGFGHELVATAGPRPLRPAEQTPVDPRQVELVIADPPHGAWVVAASTGEARLHLASKWAAGWGLVAIEDVDGDGACDVGALRYGPDHEGMLFGVSLVLHSGADGRALFRRDAEWGEPAGDYDGDGCPDLLVLRRDEGEKKWLEVLSGRRGTTIMNFVTHPDTEVHALGDLDGDGIADVSSQLGTTVDLLSGRSKRRISSIELPVRANPEESRAHVVLAGDLNASGAADFLVVHGDSKTFAAYDEDGALLYEADAGLVRGDPVVIGDLNTDGAPDFALVGPREVQLRCGRGGEELWGFRTERDGDPHLAVAPIGDVDGDGAADYAIAETRGREPFAAPSTVTAFSGRSGEPLWRLTRALVQAALDEQPR